MKAILMMCVLLAVGCGSHGSDQIAGAAGSAGAPAIHGGAGGDLPRPEPLDTRGWDPLCLELYLEQSGGLWCLPDDDTGAPSIYVERGDRLHCVSCYKRECVAGSDGWWLPVEC